MEFLIAYLIISVLWYVNNVGNAKVTYNKILGPILSFPTVLLFYVFLFLGSAIKNISSKIYTNE